MSFELTDFLGKSHFSLLHFAQYLSHSSARVAIITGANTGIGKQTAKVFHFLLVLIFLWLNPAYPPFHFLTGFGIWWSHCDHGWSQHGPIACRC
jgi:hypothetical protein